MIVNLGVHEKLFSEAIALSAYGTSRQGHCVGGVAESKDWLMIPLTRRRRPICALHLLPSRTLLSGRIVWYSPFDMRSPSCWSEVASDADACMRNKQIRLRYNASKLHIFSLKSVLPFLTIFAA